MKLCRDCRWMQPNDEKPEEVICSHPTSIFVHDASLVTGAPARTVQLPCALARGKYGVSAGQCDREGKHWEPRVMPGFVDP